MAGERATASNDPRTVYCPECRKYYEKGEKHSHPPKTDPVDESADFPYDFETPAIPPSAKR